MNFFGAVLDEQANRYERTANSHAPLYTSAPLPESLPKDVADQLKPRGDPYAKVKVLFEYASDRITALQKKTTPGGEGFFFASSDNLLATLRGQSSADFAASGVGSLSGFGQMPEAVQAVVKSGTYDIKFCRKWDGQRFVVHEEEVLPLHKYEFVVVVSDGSVRLGWRWAFSGTPTRPFGPRWLYEALCQDGENPQEKLNSLVTKIRAWAEALRAQQHDLLDGFGSEFRSLPSPLQDILARWCAANDDSWATEDLAPYAGKSYFVHQAQLDDEHWRRLYAEIRLASKRQPAALDLMWTWAE